MTRAYRVWIKGRRITTEQTVTAATKLHALIAFAAQHGLKSYQCDGRKA